MGRLAPWQGLLLASGVTLFGCNEEQVSLGAWPASQVTGSGGLGGGTTGGGGSGGGATSQTSGANTGGTGGQAGAPPTPPPFPECLAEGETGPINAPGPYVGPTDTTTDWVWPNAVNAFEWDLMIERAVPRTVPNTGYYWMQLFRSTEDLSGRLGLQANGGFNPCGDGAAACLEFTKIAVFWLSGELDAELVSIQAPDAYVRNEPLIDGTTFTSIIARFDWQPCRVYRFRFGPYATEPDGSTWYEASIRDMGGPELTILGRMLVPAGSGQINDTSSRTLSIPGYGTDLASCDFANPASAVFSAPRSTSGNTQAAFLKNLFADGLRLGCASSRFTTFDGVAVRHELSVPP